MRGIRYLLILCVVFMGTVSAFSQGILQAEYFWDTDPGPGNGTAMTVSDGNFDEALEEVFSNGITLPAVGNHTFNVRMLDSLNTWGPLFTAVISIESGVVAQAPSITAAEYYWDTDPGPGSGTAFLAFDGNYDEALESVFANGIPLLPTGLHTFNVRMRDSLTIWGPVFTTVLSIENTVTPNVPAINAAEFFWDTDPGPGNGSTMIAFDGNFNEAIEQASSSPALPVPNGLHTFNTRLRGTNNTWGPVFTTVVSIEDTIIATDRVILAGEAFWDVDPGVGNGLPLLVADGNFDEALEEVNGSLATLSLSLGPHSFNLRKRDALNQWGPVFTTVVWIDTSLVPITSQISGATALCESQGATGILYTTLYNPGDTYNWTVVGGTITSGQGTDSVMVNWAASGPYSISVEGCNSNGCGNTLTEIVTITPALNPVVSNAGSTTVCNGDTLELTAANGSGLDIQWLQNGNTISGATNSNYSATASGNYQVIFSDAGNCPDTSAGVAVTVLPALNPVISNTGPNNVCDGDTLELMAANSSGLDIQWLLNGTIINGATNSNYLTTTPGNYQVVFSNGGNCADTSAGVAVTVFPALNPVITNSGSANVCNGDTLELTSANGGGLDIQWLQNGSSIGGATSSNYAATSSGNYQVIFSDAGNCPDTSASIAVTVLSALVVDAGADQTLCFGIDSVALGGSPAANGSLGPYTYQWTGTGLNNSGLPNPNAAPTSSGSYSLMVQDSAGCTSSDVVLITLNPQIVAQAGSDTSVCDGASAVLGGAPSGSGGSGSLNYTWFPTTGLSNPNSPNPTASPSSGGNYELTIQDNAGCTEKDTVFLHIFPALFADAGTDTSICENATLILGGSPSANGGDGPYTYDWLPSTGLSDPSIANPVATVNGNTNYSLEVTDFNNCIATANIQVTALPLPVAAFSFVTNQGLVDFTDGSQDADSVRYDFGDSNGSNANNPSHTYAASGTYTACQIAYNGCGTDTTCQVVNVVIIGTDLSIAQSPRVFPNPNSGHFAIDTRGMELESVTLRDAYGRIVYHNDGYWGMDTRIEIDLPALPAAVYHLELKGGETVVVKSLVIDRSER